MPSLGADMEHGRVIEWLVEPGDFVHRGDVLATVDTDKALMDVESFIDGVVAELLVEPGTDVPVGTPLAMITETPATATVPPIPTGRPRRRCPLPPEPSPARTDAAPDAHPPAGTHSATGAAPDSGSAADPSLRRTAARDATGPAPRPPARCRPRAAARHGKGGAITRADVERAAAAVAEPPAHPAVSVRHRSPGGWPLSSGSTWRRWRAAAPAERSRRPMSRLAAAHPRRP